MSSQTIKRYGLGTVFQDAVEQRRRCSTVGVEMTAMGMERTLVSGIVEGAMQIPQVFDLLMIWADEQDPSARAEVLELINDELARAVK